MGMGEVGGVKRVAVPRAPPRNLLPAILSTRDSFREPKLKKLCSKPQERWKEARSKQSLSPAVIPHLTSTLKKMLADGPQEAAQCGW